MAVIPGEHQVGQDIEIGHIDEPVTATCENVFNLPETMSVKEFDQWITRQEDNPKSLLNRQRKKIEDQDSLDTFQVSVDDASIEVKADSEQDALEKARGIYQNSEGAKLEVHMLGEVHK